MSDFFGIGTGIGNALAGISGLVNAGVNYNIGQKNFDLQKDNLAYQKEMQQQSWARDDNAIQRRLKDLQAAGLSPTLAAGSAASNAGVVSTSAPQRESAPDMSGSFSKFADVFTSMMSMKQAQSQISQTDAQTAFINAQVNNLTKDGLIKDEAYKEALMKNKYLEDKLVSELSHIIASTDNVLSNKAYTDSRTLTEDLHRAIDNKDWEYFQALGEAFRRGPSQDITSKVLRIIELLSYRFEGNSGFKFDDTSVFNNLLGTNSSSLPDFAWTPSKGVKSVFSPLTGDYWKGLFKNLGVLGSGISNGFKNVFPLQGGK